MKESQLDNKTSIATNDYVRMVDENNNSVKIKKDSFMAAIRDALPSILESGGTGGGSVLSVIGGILKTRTDADLASVLGGALMTAKDYPATITTYNDAVRPGFWFSGSWADAPNSDSGCLFVLQRGSVIYQLWFAASLNIAFYRRKDINGNWRGWVQFIGAS